MRLWIQKIDKHTGTLDISLEQLSKEALDIALIKSNDDYVKVVMILPHKYNDLKHHWED